MATKPGEGVATKPDEGVDEDDDTLELGAELVPAACQTCGRGYWVYHRMTIAKCNMCEKPHLETYQTKMYFGKTQ